MIPLKLSLSIAFFNYMLLFVEAADLKPKDKLIFVLLDGLRWDYTNSLPESGGFKQFIKHGVKAKHMVPSYPAESYPNYFALTTGLYGENHGIVFNYMYDPEKNTTFALGKGDNSWYSHVEPVWATAVRNNISTANIGWPLGDQTMVGVRATYANKFKPFYISPYVLKNKLRKAVDFIASGEMDYCQVFGSWGDVFGHVLGPFVAKNIVVPFFIDDVILDFFNYIKKKKIKNNLNVVIVSDHGMARSDSFAVKDVRIDRIIDMADIRMMTDYGAHRGLYPISKEKEDKIYNQLKGIKGIKVYRKDEIPERYHVKNSDRVPPIYIVSSKGYFMPYIKSKKQIGEEDIPGIREMGSHGYDPLNFPDMWGTFIAFGPAFNKGIEVAAFNNIDVYNLLCHLLDIKSLPNNGTWEHVKDMLISD